jgi:hypothetical protein
VHQSKSMWMSSENVESNDKDVAQLKDADVDFAHMHERLRVGSKRCGDALRDQWDPTPLRAAPPLPGI